MSRKKKAAEHANHERWLVSYADFITLLFAFFVVLFSSSQVDKRKVGKISAAMQEAFATDGNLPGGQLAHPHGDHRSLTDREHSAYREW